MVEMSIQEPSGDLISRQAVMNCIDEYSQMIIRPLELKDCIDKLPSVTPQSKMGHWVLTSDDDYEYCTCSECGYQNGENWMIGSQIKFCQECGAKMVEKR